MKTILIAFGLMVASLVRGVTAGWNDLDWGRAETMALGEPHALGAAKEWAVRVILPTFTHDKQTFRGTLRLHTSGGEMLGRGAFEWSLGRVGEKLERQISVALSSDGAFPAPHALSWSPVYLEWRRSEGWFSLFASKADGSGVSLGSWKTSAVFDALEGVSLEVSDGQAFSSAQFLVVTSSLAPEPGVGVVLAVGVLSLFLRRRVI